MSALKAGSHATAKGRRWKNQTQSLYGVLCTYIPPPTPRAWFLPRREGGGALAKPPQENTSLP